MLTPKNNFSREASIGPVPSRWLHPALIGGQKGGRQGERDCGGREAGARVAGGVADGEAE